MAAPLDSRTLVQLVEAMFESDGDGRLLGQSPHLFVLRTPELVIFRCHADLPDTCAAALAATADQPRGKPGEWAREYGQYLSLLDAFAPARAIRAGPLYRFPAMPEPVGDLVVVGEADTHLLAGDLQDWLPDVAAGRPMVVARADGRAASVCASVRASASAHCAGVETVPQHRGKGLATQAVAAWARLIRSCGAEPFYATTFDNIASQGVARRLGLELIGAEFSVECAAA